MGLFGKNQNEVNYVGGKKHFADVIKNTSPSDTLIWLNGEEDFNTNSTLIVAESEEALFFKDGVIEQVFTGGKYKLDTNNYPFISRLRNAFTGGISTFNCKVYFVNKVHSMEVLWGTDSPIQVRDPIQGIATSVMARGAYRVQVQDSKKFLVKMAGNSKAFMTEQDMTVYFRSQFSQHIKSSIARYIKNSNEEILGICSEQDMLAEQITDYVAEAFDEYGIRLVNFSIAALDIPENDPGRMQLEEAYAQRRANEIHGISWAQRTSADILKDVAQNPGAGGMAAAGAGLGMGVAAGGVFGTMAQQMFAPMQGAVTGMTPAQPQAQQPQPTQASRRFVQSSPAPTAPTAPAAAPASGADEVKCPACGTVNKAGSKFCNNCGNKLEQEKPKCPACGAENAPGAKFCNNCGSPMNAVPGPKKCSGCGAELEPGVRFCSECGTPVS